jgi:hypothetical protein
MSLQKCAEIRSRHIKPFMHGDVTPSSTLHPLSQVRNCSNDGKTGRSPTHVFAAGPQTFWVVWRLLAAAVHHAHATGGGCKWKTVVAKHWKTEATFCLKMTPCYQNVQVLKRPTGFLKIIQVVRDNGN